MKRVFGLSILCSLGVHLVPVVRWLGTDVGFEAKDVDDDLTIPTDLLDDTVAKQEETPATQDPAQAAQGPGTTTRDAGAASDARADATDASSDARPVDAAARDAARRVVAEAGGASSTVDGGLAVMTIDGGLAESSDGGAGSGPRDPGSMIGMAGLVQAGPVNVTLLVNMAVIRANPTGAKLGPIVTGLPQWSDFLRGADTAFDPVKETDWILIYGPSLIHTDRDAVLVHYSADDARIDSAIDKLSAAAGDEGGPFDAGVAGVKATLGHADNAQRVFLRAQPHLLAVVPPAKAKEFAQALKRRAVAPKVRAGEAMRLVVRDPHRQVAIKGLKFPEELKEIRLWIAPKPDGSADVFAEGDCTSEASATLASEMLTDVIHRTNSGLIKMGTGGLLNDAKIDAEGTRITMHIVATADQLERTLGTVGLLLGVEAK